jgi:hypothetical protein
MSLLKVWVPASARMTVVRVLRTDEERGFDEEIETQPPAQFPIQEPLPFFFKHRLHQKIGDSLLL